MAFQKPTPKIIYEVAPGVTTSSPTDATNMAFEGALRRLLRARVSTDILDAEVATIAKFVIENKSELKELLAFDFQVEHVVLGRPQPLAQPAPSAAAPAIPIPAAFKPSPAPSFPPTQRTPFASPEVDLDAEIARVVKA